MVMAGDVEHVLARHGQDGHDLVAEPARDVAHILFRLVRTVHHADDPIHLRVGVGGGDHAARPFLLRGGGGFAVEVDEQHATHVVGVVALIRSRCVALVVDAVDEEVRLPVGHPVVVVDLVIADRRHDGHVLRQRLGLPEVQVLVVVQRADVDLVAVVDDDVDDLFQRLAVQRFDLRARRVQHRQVAALVADLVVARDEDAVLAADLRRVRLRAEAEHVRYRRGGAHAVVVEAVRRKA